MSDFESRVIWRKLRACGWTPLQEDKCAEVTFPRRVPGLLLVQPSLMLLLHQSGLLEWLPFPPPLPFSNPLSSAGQAEAGARSFLLRGMAYFLGCFLHVPTGWVEGGP